MATVEIKFKDLREAVAALNETNLITEKIKLVGSPKEVILQQFMDVMAKVPDDAEGKFPGPKVCLDFYNSILDAEEKAAKEKTEEVETKPDAEVPSTEAPVQTKENKPVKPPKEKKEKVVKEEKEKKQRTGWKSGSVCDKIHRLIIDSKDQGISLENAIIEANKFGSKDTYTKAIFAECIRYNLAEKKEGRYFQIIK